MSQTPKPESTPTLPPQTSPYPRHNSPYSRMSQRRAIACTICAKAKTKCDKAVPSCSRCTAKGLPCEPRSTRRTSDSNYRNPTKKHIVSPKRFSSTNSMPTMSRHSSPRSVPSSERHHLVRAVSQMDMHTAAKMGHQRTEFSNFPMLTPLQTFAPQIIDECYSYSSSPEQNMAVFSHAMDNNGFFNSGRLTPQTPDSFTYHEPLSIADPFDQYMNTQAWSDDGQMPIGLGFENDIPGMMQVEPMWSTPEPEGNATPMGHMNSFDSPVCGSPASINAWPHPSLSVSPPQIPHSLPHARAVPSLSISECSVQDFDSPRGVQEDWPSFRPNPNGMVMGKPNTSAAYLDDVKAIPRNSLMWEDVIISRMSTNHTTALKKYLSLNRIEVSLRDTVMDVANRFIQQARRLSKSSARLSPPSLPISTPVGGVDDSLPSPSTTVLETLIRSYGSRFEPFYQNFAAKSIDLSGLLQSDASKIHLLLILAAGASAIRTREAFFLTNGLIESSRILLGDLTDKNASLWKNPETLRAALLYMNLAAWSGEKWHMDVAKTQSSLVFEMVRRSGLFTYREKSVPEFDGLVGIEVGWKAWCKQESLNRLAYSWVIADQELSLFHDEAPNFCTTDLTAALPDRETLWQATTADSWSMATPSKTGTPPSLHDLFKRLMSRELVNEPRKLTRLQLRLLLQPLQALVHQIHQCIGSFTADLPENHLVHMRDAQAILGDWFALCCRRMQAEEGICPVLLSNFIMYHLVTLNTMTHFPEVEGFARGEVTQEQFMATTWARTKALGSTQRIWFHCGQLIRYIRLMPGAHRPQWIPAVVYRVCLLLWSTSIAMSIISLTQPVAPLSGSAFAIDSVSLQDETLVRYLSAGHGTPMLCTREGVWFSLTTPTDTLKYSLDVLKEEELDTNFAVGIRNRLKLLLGRVKSF